MSTRLTKVESSDDNGPSKSCAPAKKPKPIAKRRMSTRMTNVESSDDDGLSKSCAPAKKPKPIVKRRMSTRMTKVESSDDDEPKFVGLRTYSNVNQSILFLFFNQENIYKNVYYFYRRKTTSARDAK